MSNFIQGAKVGSIVRTVHYGQYFYVHNIHDDIMEMSGIGADWWFFDKYTRYIVHEVVPTSEEHIFYDLLIKYGYKLDLNKGVLRI